MSQYFGFTFNQSMIEDQLDKVKKIHDHTLDRVGPKSSTHRTHHIPFDKKLKKKKKFKTKRELQHILGTYEYKIEGLCTKAYFL